MHKSLEQVNSSKTHGYYVSRGRITVYIKNCKGCGLCIVKCPNKSLRWSEYLGLYGTPAVEVDWQTCILCGQCALICPDSAVIVEYIPRPQRRRAYL